MTDKISVIVPIYNAEEHLHDFFKTLLAQTYENLEIICVDDGSSDKTPEILDKYRLTDDRIIVIRQDNQGAGVARNTGLAKATGTYCSFLDCDDSFEPRMYEILQKKCSETESDICICDADSYFADTGRPAPKKRFIDWQIITTKDVFTYRDMPNHIFTALSPVPWNKLYRTNFIREKKLLFQDTRNTNDVCFVYTSLAIAARITITDDILIHKTILADSVSRSSSKQWKDSYLAYMKLKNDLIKAGVYKEVELSYLHKAMSSMLWNLPLLTHENYLKLYDFLKDEGLASLGVTEREDGEIYYGHSDAYELIKTLLHSSPEVYRLTQIEKLELIRSSLFGKSLEISVRCPIPLEGTYTEIGIKHHRSGDDAPEFITFPATIRTSKDSIVLTGKIPLNDVRLKETYWDIFCVYEINGERFHIFVKSKLSASSLIKLFFSRNYIFRDDKIVYYFPFRKCMRIVVRERAEYDGAMFRFKELIAVSLAMLLKKNLNKQKIMLIHEKKCYRAADNGYAFFKYCMENGLEKRLNRKIYYVIDKRSPHYEMVKKWNDHIIDYLSVKHIIYAISCKLMVSSESRAHDYIRDTSSSLAKPLIQKKKHLYLKHGIFGIKKINPAPFAYNKSALLIAVSEKEAGILRKNLRYDRASIAVTGSARFDSLKNQSANNREILMMPSIRKSLFSSGEEDFRESKYYQMYSEFLKSERLNEVLRKNEYTLKYFLHPSFSHFIHLFESKFDHIKVVRDDEAQIRDLLISCKMLITDYSSVTWDALYMNKPVLFFQFDLDDFEQIEGSYMDMRTDLPGDRCETADELINLIERYAKAGFSIPEKYSTMRGEFFAYTDNKNCERIAAEIKKRKL